MKSFSKSLVQLLPFKAKVSFSGWSHKPHTKSVSSFMAYCRKELFKLETVESQGVLHRA